MKIVVFGASGRTGREVVTQALAAGHGVVAFVRSPARLGLEHPHLTVVQGDVVNASDVQQAVPTDATAVITALSPGRESPPDMLPAAAENIITTMKQRGVKRLIYMTGAGVDMPQDKPQLINHIIKFALKTLSGAVLEQSIRAVNLVQNSELEWTIVRAPMLTNNPATGHYRVGWVGVNTGPRLTREDAAAFIVAQLDDQTYLHQGPMVSN